MDGLGWARREDLFVRGLLDNWKILIRDCTSYPHVTGCPMLRAIHRHGKTGRRVGEAGAGWT